MTRLAMPRRRIRSRYSPVATSAPATQAGTEQIVDEPGVPLRYLLAVPHYVAESAGYRSIAYLIARIRLASALAALMS